MIYIYIILKRHNGLLLFPTALGPRRVVGITPAPYGADARRRL